MSGARKAAFAASVDEDVRVLILGSLPGDASLAARQYYANPTNQFWRLVGGALGVNVAALPYEERLGRLLAGGIGLWDVIKSAHRPGSGDGEIRDHEANGLRALAATLPKLRAIAFNGGKAASLGRRELGDGGVPVLIDLPSSSAAHCSVSFSAKQAKWLVLRDYLDFSRSAAA